MKRIFIFTLLVLGRPQVALANELVHVRGTQCSLVPPSGFTVSTTFAGIQNNELGASIMVNQVPGAHYKAMIGDFNAENLKQRGMTLVGEKTIKFNNHPASYFDITQSIKGALYNKKLLAFSDGLNTYLINGVYPESSNSIAKQVDEAIMSLVCDPSQQDNPLDAARYSIDTDGTDFFFAQFFSGNLIYSNTKKPTPDSPSIIVASPLAKVPIKTEQRKAYAESRIKSLPRGSDSTVRESNPINIDKMDGYETIADGKSADGKPTLIYQVALFDGKGSQYLIIGRTTADFDTYLKTFKKIARTFKRK